jgi:hypothetical protein
VDVAEQLKRLMKDHIDCKTDPEKCSQCAFNDVDITLSTMAKSDVAAATSMCRLLEILREEVTSRYAGVSVDERNQRLSRND